MRRRVNAGVAVLIVAISAAACGPRQPGSAAPPPLPPGVRANHLERTYPVHGTTPDEILRSLAGNRVSTSGGSFQGLHTWRMTWAYRYAPAGGVCRMRSVEVRLESEIVVPRWEDRERADSSVTRWWDDYIGRLRAHENTHRAIAYRGAREIQRQLKRVSSPTCGTISARANTVARQILERAKARNAAYDEETRHGWTEGVRPPDPPPGGAPQGPPPQ